MCAAALGYRAAMGSAGIVENQGHAPGELFRPQNSLLQGPPAYMAQTPWTPIKGLLATIAIVGLSIIAGLVLLTLLGGDGAMINMPGPQSAAAEATAGLRFFAIWQAGVVVLTLLASTVFGGRIRDVLALRPPAGGWRTYGGAIVALAALQAAVSGVQYMTNRGDLYVDLRPFVDLVRGPEWVLAAAVIGIGAPLSEELLFRGFLLSALARSRLGFWGAALIATALWTSLHVGYTVVGILEVSIVGLFFSWLLWRTGSLRVAILCHALYNSLIVLALRFVDLPVTG
jgi:membrane protease YdiL (CAAX protease family)